MRGKIDAQTRMDPGASCIVDGGGPVLSVRVAEECNRISGRELTEVKGRVHADLARRAKARELDLWNQFMVVSPVKVGAQSEYLADTGRALNRKEVDGLKTGKSQLVARGYQDPDLRTDNVDIAGRVSRRPSHLQLISLGASKQWPLWGLDIKSAFPQEDGFDREV